MFQHTVLRRYEYKGKLIFDHPKRFDYFRKSQLTHVAARLLLYGVYKDVYGEFANKSLLDMININIERGVCDAEILNLYNEDEINHQTNTLNVIEMRISYCRFTPSIDKIRVDRSNRQLFEIPTYV